MGPAKSSVDGACSSCHNAHNVRCHLKKATGYLKPDRRGTDPRGANLYNSLPQQGHKGSVPWQNANESVIGWRDDAVGLPFEHCPFRGNDRNVHYAEAIFLACVST